VDGLGRFEKELTAGNLECWLRKLRPQKVQLALPRFRLSQDLPLSHVLAELGMPLAFGNGADFSGLSEAGEELYLSKVLHRALMQVDEQGTVAVAATAVVGRSKMAAARRLRPVVVRADHPFLFLIRDRNSGSVLFLGRVCDPGPGNDRPAARLARPVG
jgi:serpin B